MFKIKNKVLKRILSILKIILMIFLLVLAIESGYWYLYLLGMMGYGAWIKRDVYKTWFSWYKGALKNAWNKGEIENIDILSMTMNKPEKNEDNNRAEGQGSKNLSQQRGQKKSEHNNSKK
jgi:hypothetical protein